MVLKNNKIKFHFKSSFTLKLLNKNLKENVILNKNNKIFLKNFIIFIFLISHFWKKNNTNYLRLSLTILPKKIKKILILRAPFRHKLSKKHYKINSWNFILTLSLNNNIFEVKKQLINFWKNYFLFFETNICSLQKISFFFNINFNIK